MSLNSSPDSELISEEELRAALRPLAVDAESFEEGIRERIRNAEVQRSNDPLAGAPELVRVAASVLPIFTGGKATASAVPLANASLFTKVLGYVAMPAVSLFVMVGAFGFSVAGIRRLQRGNVPQDLDAVALNEATRDWWQQHRWLAGLFFAVSLGMSFLQATSLLLMLYLISMGVLLLMLRSLAKLGLGNRQVIGGSCAAGLAMLGQTSAIATNGLREIHFVDQMLLPAVFFTGVLILCVLLKPGKAVAVPMTDRKRELLLVLLCLQGGAIVAMWWPRLHGWIIFLGCCVTFLVARVITDLMRKAKFERPAVGRVTGVVLLLAFFGSLIGWCSQTVWWPVTPERNKNYVETFEKPLSSPSWEDWGVTASWSKEAGLDPDFALARRQVATATTQNFYLLGGGVKVACRLGLLTPDEINKLTEGQSNYATSLRMLVDDPHHVAVQRPIAGVASHELLIRTAVLRNDLTPADKDVLASRLLVNWDHLSDNPYGTIEEPLRITQLSAALGRPLNIDRHRGRVHAWLSEFHATDCGIWRESGGFRIYRNMKAGDLLATAQAVDLMQVYGVPSES